MEMNWAITCVCLFFETKSLLVIHAWKVYECFLRSNMWCSQLSRAPHSLEKLDTDYSFKFLNTWISQFNEGNIQSVHEINQILKSPISKPYLEDNNRHRFGLKIDLTQGRARYVVQQRFECVGRRSHSTSRYERTMSLHRLPCLNN